MKQATLKSQLKTYLRETGCWVHKGQIEEMRWKNQKNFTYYLASNVNRTLQKMREYGIIEVRDDKNRKSVEYRYAIPKV